MKFAAWRESTPPGFLFAAKGSRFITHMKKLSNPEASIEKYFDRVRMLGRNWSSHMNAVLSVLPADW